MTTNDEIKALVEATIQTKIIQAFHDAPEAIDKLVEGAMSQAVDEHGGKPGSYSRTSMPYLQWLVGDTIRRIARTAVEDAIAGQREQIEEAVKRAVTADEMVKGITSKIIGTLDEDWRVTVKFSDEDK